MASHRNNGAFIVGSVIGGLVGAVVTLWITPKSGAELRRAVTSEETRTSVTGRVRSNSLRDGQRFSNPVLSFVERTVAPIVGVELGKQASDDPETVNSVPVRRSSADARPPVAAASEPRQAVDTYETLNVDEHEVEAVNAEGEVTDSRAATAEDLTTPPEDYAERLRTGAGAETTDEPGDFPDLPSRDRT